VWRGVTEAGAQSTLGGGWRQQASVAASAAVSGVPTPPSRAASVAPGATRVLHGRPVSAAPAAQMPKGVTRNGPCPCGSGTKWKRCCGKDT